MKQVANRKQRAKGCPNWQNIFDQVIGDESDDAPQPAPASTPCASVKTKPRSRADVICDLFNILEELVLNHSGTEFFENWIRDLAEEARREQKLLENPPRELPIIEFGGEM